MTQVLVSTGFLVEEEVVALAHAVERLGFDGITMPEHLFHTHHEGPYPYSADGKPPFRPETPWPDALTVFAALGLATQRLRFMTSVLLLPLRHPLSLAKAAGTASRLSDGRLTLGIGVGWMREEFDTLGIDFSTRGRRANEMIAALRTLWSTGPVEHEGEFFSFGQLLMEPLPPRIPIVVGGSSTAALRRAARLGDGYLLPSAMRAELPAVLARLREQLADVERPEGDFEIIVPCLDDSPAQVELLVEQGADVVIVTPWPMAGKYTTSLGEKLDRLERYAEDVLPLLHSVTR